MYVFMALLYIADSVFIAALVYFACLCLNAKRHYLDALTCEVRSNTLPY